MATTSRREQISITTTGTTKTTKTTKTKRTTKTTKTYKKRTTTQYLFFLPSLAR